MIQTASPRLSPHHTPTVKAVEREVSTAFFWSRQQGEGTVVMSNSSKVIVLSAIAAALSVGAVQLASGHGLTVGLRSAASTTTNSVNRSAKSDRAKPLPAIGQTKTISLHLSQFADTSFLLRIPAAPAPAEAVGNTTGTATSSSQPGIKRQDTKRPIACEPSVSVLTEIAKSLQPGRCVT